MKIDFKIFKVSYKKVGYLLFVKKNKQTNKNMKNN